MKNIRIVHGTLMYPLEVGSRAPQASHGSSPAAIPAGHFRHRRHPDLSDLYLRV